MDNMENKNNEFNNNEKKPIDKNKMAKVLSAIVFLGILFCATYFVTDYLNSLNRRNIADNESEKVVLNQTPNILKDDMIITLKTKNNIDSEKKVSELKVELGLTGEVTKESLSKALESKGYSISGVNQDKLVFNRESEHNLIPNKFYLGEKDGMLAVFKTSETGEPEPIYIDKAPINILPEVNQESLRSFEKYYDTEEEALMRLTAYTS